MNKITPTWYLLYDFQWLPEKRLLTPKQEDVIYKFYKTPKNSETFDLNLCCIIGKTGYAMFEEDIAQSTEHKLVFKFSSFSFAGKGRVKAMIKDVQVWVPRTL
jgi:hypothetical protein